MYINNTLTFFFYSYGNQKLVQYNISCPPGHLAFFNMTYIELEEPNCYDKFTDRTV